MWQAWLPGLLISKFSFKNSRTTNDKNTKDASLIEAKPPPKKNNFLKHFATTKTSKNTRLEGEMKPVGDLNIRTRHPDQTSDLGSHRSIAEHRGAAAAADAAGDVAAGGHGRAQLRQWRGRGAAAAATGATLWGTEVTWVAGGLMGWMGWMGWWKEIRDENSWFYPKTSQLFFCSVWDISTNKTSWHSKWWQNGFFFSIETCNCAPVLHLEGPFHGHPSHRWRKVNCWCFSPLWNWRLRCNRDVWIFFFKTRCFKIRFLQTFNCFFF